MTRGIRLALVLSGLIFTVGLAACSDAMSPASPTSAGASTGQVGSEPAVGLTGVVSSLNVDTRTFTLTVRGGSRLVRADAETTVWNQPTNSRVRFSALKDGNVASIRGFDKGRYVLARSIVITR
jgi:hypothetical protein